MGNAKEAQKTKESEEQNGSNTFKLGNISSTITQSEHQKREYSRPTTKDLEHLPYLSRGVLQKRETTSTLEEQIGHQLMKPNT